MKIIENILLSENRLKKSYVAIGAFDGIHLGHRELIVQAVKKAKLCGGNSVVFTFLNHPMETIAGDYAPSLINTLNEKIYLLESLGVDYLILQPFTLEFSELSPHKFVEIVLKQMLDSREVFVGFNFSFGKEKAGDVNTLEKIAKEYKIKVKVIAPIKMNDQIISSTFIRKKLKNGNLEIANRCLGYPFLISGKVIHGKKIARTLGFPTANLEMNNKIYPSFGIYGGKVQIEGENDYRYAVINIGKNPTLKPDEKSIEVHLLDFDGDLYGKVLHVHLLEYLRNEKKFNSVKELKTTIKSDITNWKNKVREL